MIDLEFLRGLIDAVDQSGVDSFEISRGGTRIRIAKTPPPAPQHAGNHTFSLPAPVGEPVRAAVAPTETAQTAEVGGTPAPASAAGNLVEIKSPMVGTFYRAPSPEAPAYVESGTRVSKGQTLCILEAMKLMNELESEVSGVIREICVDNSEPVEYGQVLFRIEPSE
jgi:acetyl-CoA carboxylase biotin carboxyl carrier protein